VVETMGVTTTYVRFQSPTPNARGVHPGIFALVNGLTGLSPADERLRTAGNAWFEQNFTDPSTVDPGVYDREANPGAVAWFKGTSPHLVERASRYLDLLAAHGVACERAESDAPGRIVYEDEHQVVVVPG